MKQKLIYIVYCIAVVACLAMMSCKEDYGGEYYPMSWGVDFDSFIGSVGVYVDGNKAIVSCGPTGGSVSLTMSRGLDLHGYYEENGEWVNLSDSVIKNDWCEVTVKGRECTVLFPEDISMESHQIKVYLDNIMCTSGGFLILRRQP